MGDRILHNDRLNAFRVRGGEAKSDWSPVILNNQRIPVEAERLREGVDHAC
jgi:hypothetical protein